MDHFAYRFCFILAFVVKNSVQETNVGVNKHFNLFSFPQVLKSFQIKWPPINFLKYYLCLGNPKRALISGVHRIF
jgi:hypothetical protein